MFRYAYRSNRNRRLLGNDWLHVWRLLRSGRRPTHAPVPQYDPDVHRGGRTLLCHVRFDDPVSVISSHRDLVFAPISVRVRR